jgi:hypothetical protein
MRDRRSGHRRALWGVSALALVGPVVMVATPGSSSAASRPSVKEPKYDFSMSLPAKWTTIPLDGSDITSLLNSATHDDPTLSNALNSQVKAATKQGIKVFAVGPVSGTTVPNVSVADQSASGAPSGNAFPPAAAVEAKISLGEAGAKGIKTSTIHDRLGDVAQVVYSLPLTTGTVDGVQLYAEHRSRIVIMTVTTSSPATALSAAHTIAGSWRWT